MLKKGNRQEDKDEAKAEWERAQAKSEELDNGTRSETKGWPWPSWTRPGQPGRGGVNLRETIVRFRKI